MIAMLILCALLSGCGGSGTGGGSGGSSGGEAGTVDYNLYINEIGYVGYTEGAIIIGGSGAFTYLPLSLEQGETSICTKADCTHRNPNTCSAFVDADGGYISVWQDQIYYLDAGLGLYRMELDGTGRTEIRALEMTQGLTSYSFSYKMYNGWLALKVTDYETDSELSTCYLVPLEDAAAEPIVLRTIDTAEEPGWSMSAFDIWVFDDFAFYLYMNWEAGEYQLCNYRLSTGETTLLSEQWDGLRQVTWRDGRLYYLKDGVELGWLDPETGAQTVVAEALQPEATAYGGAFDDQYIYVQYPAEDGEAGGASSVEPGVYVYDYEGNFLQYVHYLEGMEQIAALIATPEYMFYTTFPPVSYASVQFPPVCYLERTALADGTAEFIPLE